MQVFSSSPRGEDLWSNDTPFFRTIVTKFVVSDLTSMQLLLLVLLEGTRQHAAATPDASAMLANYSLERNPGHNQEGPFEDHKGEKKL